MRTTLPFADPVASPAVAGHQPLLLAIAISACFAGSVLAQPTGAQAIHGAAALSQQGNKLTVTTQNGAGSNHSAINWQSFSIPAGSTTQFNQPSASSTSINRVVTNNPSAIFGTLSSNGRLVLVNPAGIAVGAGAVVDTAGFTASTLRMSDADALAGRLRFEGGANGLTVGGQILARNGDVVLLAPSIETAATALIQSPNGATILAAGQKAELTGRGLEGIKLELQAPDNSALNLGVLTGDAVGMFAGTLKHSGLISANAVTVEGGKVVLRSRGDTLVDGHIAAAAGPRGGAIDVLGQRVALFGAAALDASGPLGGGQVRIGGDYQGANAAIQNATHTFVGETVSIRADAGNSGDGGRVIIWSDETTRMHGKISARGGAEGGNGGFAEVSGKQHLEFDGRIDLRSPRGANGMLLLDPYDITIVNCPAPTCNSASPAPGGYTFTSSSSSSTITNGDLEAQLALSDVRVQSSSAPPRDSGAKITVDAPVQWSDNELVLEADQGGIVLNANLTGTGTAKLALIAHGTGAITQNSGSIVEVPKLLVATEAGAATMLSDNKVGILAANVQALDFKNAIALTVGSLTFNSSFIVSAVDGIWATGDVTLTSASGFTLGANVKSDTGNVSLIGSGAVTFVGPGREIDAAGDVSFATGQLLRATGDGGITIRAGTAGVAGGSIAGEPNISTGSFGFVSGPLVLEARGTDGSITVGTIDTTGKGVLPNGNGRPGGSVTITTIGGAIQTGAISTYGYDGNPGYFGGGAGGDGGPVSLGSTSGSIKVTSFLNLDGGNSASVGSAGGGGGSGGKLDITTSGVLELGTVSAYGGSGGDHDWGTGGTGGNAGPITFGSAAQGFGAGSTFGPISVDGGPGGDATMGAHAGGRGGAGGDVKLFAEGDLNFLGAIYASGGDGGENRSTLSSDARGGDGGAISIAATGRVTFPAGTTTLRSSGGYGGNFVVAGAAPGKGGDGKAVTVTSGAAENIMVQGTLNIHNWGGGPGSEDLGEEYSVPYSSPETPQGYGADGPLMLTPGSGGTTLVSGVLHVDGSWTHTGNMSVSGQVKGYGRMFNAPGAMIDVAAGGAIQPWGGFDNSGGTVTANGSGSRNVNLISNSGTIEIGSGATLALTHWDGASSNSAGGELTNLSGGYIQGEGTLKGDLVNEGTVRPGLPTAFVPTGTLTIDGNFSQSPSGRLEIDIDPGSSNDQLVITGLTALSGTLAVNEIPAMEASFFLPMSAGSYTIIDAQGGFAPGEQKFSSISDPAGLGGQLVMSVAGTPQSIPVASTGGAGSPPPPPIAPPTAPPPVVPGSPVPPPVTAPPPVSSVPSPPVAAPPSAGPAMQDPVNQVVVFMDLIKQTLEEPAQKKKDVTGGSDIVFTDQACKP